MAPGVFAQSTPVTDVVEQIEGIKDNAVTIFNACIPIVVAAVAFAILLGYAKMLKKK